MSKSALICGISGQDGAYLAKLLLEKGYRVIGASRDSHSNKFENLRKLNVIDNIEFISIAVNDFRSVLQSLYNTDPDEVYNLAGQTSVGLSFEQPVETMESIVIGTLNILEAIRFIGKPIKFYNAGSTECFGDTGSAIANENTPFRPRSPYAVAKAAAHWETANYREAYNIFACSGILSNHESPLRQDRFVTKKIISTASRISSGSNEKLSLGNINIARDWGWAPEFVETMWLMLQQPDPDDYIVATGKTYKLRDFIEAAFKLHDLNWEDHTLINDSLLRPADIEISKVSPAKAFEKLEWKAQFRMKDVVRKMTDDVPVR